LEFDDDPMDEDSADHSLNAAESDGEEEENDLPDYQIKEMDESIEIDVGEE